MQTLVYVISHERQTAQRAVDALVAAHFEATEIRILTRSGREMAKLKVELRLGLRWYVVVGITLLGVVIGGVVGGWIANHLTLEPLATWMNMMGGAVLGAAFGWLVSMVGGLSFWNQKITFPSFLTWPWGQPILVGVEVSAHRQDEATLALRGVGMGDVFASGRRTSIPTPATALP